MPNHIEHQSFSQFTERYSPPTQVAATLAVGKKSPRVEPREFSRLVVSVIAVCVAMLISLEPFVISASPGLQAFQAIFLVWFWGIFMFGGPSDPPTNEE